MIILDEKIMSGNSHLTGFYADHDDVLPVLSPKTRFSVHRLHSSRARVYAPVVIAKPLRSDIGNRLNYLADTLFLSGSTLAAAGTQREKLVTQAA